MTQPGFPEDDPLEAEFSRLRTTPPDVPDALMTRVMADAVSELPRPRRAPIWQNVLRTLGGWPAVAGLAATACVGLWAGGALSNDMIASFGFADTASLGLDSDLGAFDLLLLDG